MYKIHFIWKAVESNCLARYVCLENLENNKFSVHNVDFFNKPFDKDDIQKADVNFLELFLDVNPTERCAWHDSLISAINSHEEDFS